jgi:hypothetical protein
LELKVTDQKEEQKEKFYFIMNVYFISLAAQEEYSYRLRLALVLSMIGKYYKSWPWYFGAQPVKNVMVSTSIESQY